MNYSTRIFKQLVAGIIIALLAFPAGLLHAQTLSTQSSTESTQATQEDTASSGSFDVSGESESVSSSEGETSSEPTDSIESPNEILPEGEGENDPPYAAASSGEEEGEPALSDPIDTTHVIRPEVNPHTGAFTMSYPIYSPKGRLGIEPNISLSYNSQNTDNQSILGYGWELNIPYIKRFNKEGSEGLYTANTFVSSEYGELVHESGDSYLPLVETGSFTDFDYSNDIWVLTDKSGTTYTYGTTTDSRQDDPADPTRIFKWILEEVRDVHDNYMQYEYIKDGTGEIYPSRITYTHNDSSNISSPGPALFEINFQLESRTDQIKSFKPAFETKTAQRIHRIETKSNGTWVRRYDLDYIPSDNGERSLLEKIIQSGRNSVSGEITLPPVEFEYQEITSVWVEETGFTLPVNGNGDHVRMSYSGNNTYGSIFQDVNGDGLPDVVNWRNGTQGVYEGVWLNTGSGWSLETGFTLPINSNGDHVRMSYSGSNTYGSIFQDINGDGLPDVVNWRQGTPGAYEGVWLNTGSGWSLEAGFTLPVSSSTGDHVRMQYAKSNTYGSIFQDINGDGLPDVVNWRNGTPGVYEGVWLNTGSGWLEETGFALPVNGNGDHVRMNYSGSNIYGSIFQDVNGDGLPDVVNWRNGTPGVYEGVWLNTGSGWLLETGFTLPTNSNGDHVRMNYSDSNIYGSIFQDINADGLPDVVNWRNGTQGVYEGVWLNTGSGWLEESFTLPVNANGDHVRMQYSKSNIYGSIFQDINGDGLPDVVNWRNGNPGAYEGVWLNTGSGWSLETGFALPTTSSNGDHVRMQYARSNTYGSIFQDINADGLPDVVNWRNGTQGIYEGVWLGSGEQSSLLAKITHPTTGTIETNYKNAFTFTDSNGDALNPEAVRPIYVVDEVIYTDQIAANGYSASYEYEGGKWHYEAVYDRLFAGFSRVTKTNGAGNVSVSYFHQGDDTDTAGGEIADERHKIGYPYRTEVYDDSDNLYSLSISKIQSHDLGSGSKFVYQSDQVNLSYDGTGSHVDTAESFIYDLANGNLLTNTKWGEVSSDTAGVFTDAGTDSRTTTIEYASNSGNDIYAPKLQTLTDHSGATVRETKHYYDDLLHGNLTHGNETKTKTLLSGSSNYAQVSRDFNDYGQRTHETNEIGGTSIFYYDDHDYFVDQIRDPNISRTYYYWDYGLSQPTKIIYPNKDEDRYTYDGLGRVLTKKERTDDGAILTTEQYLYSDTSFPTSIQSRTWPELGFRRTMYDYYDGFGRAIQNKVRTQSSGTWITTDTIYDGAGRVTETSLPHYTSSWQNSIPVHPAGLTVTNQYDALDRLTDSTTVLGSTTYTYDGFETMITDALSHTKDLIYDAFGNLVTVTERPSSTETNDTVYTYNAANELTKITDPLGNTRDFTFDKAGRVTDITLPYGAGDTIHTYSYTYDDAGNVLTESQPNGTIVTRTYDAGSRITKEVSGSQTYDFFYDDCDGAMYEQGLLCYVEGNNGINRNMDYARNGLVERDRPEIDAVEYLTTYDYNSLNEITKVTHPDGTYVDTIYHRTGPAYEVLVNGQSEVKYTLDVHSLPKTVQYFGNNTTTKHTYDHAKMYQRTRTRTYENSAPSAYHQFLDYTYDAVGNITEIDDGSATITQKITNYTYDDIYRLTQAAITGSQANTGGVENGNYTYNFTYDAIGNILTGGNDTYQYGQSPVTSIPSSWFFANAFRTPLAEAQTIESKGETVKIEAEKEVVT